IEARDHAVPAPPGSGPDLQVVNHHARARPDASAPGATVPQSTPRGGDDQEKPIRPSPREPSAGTVLTKASQAPLHLKAREGAAPLRAPPAAADAVLPHLRHSAPPSPGGSFFENSPRATV